MSAYDWETEELNDAANKDPNVDPLENSERQDIRDAMADERAQRSRR